MSQPFETICVVGLGYIGLPTASLLATKGFRIHGVDVNAQVRDTIAAGGIHISEPDLDILVKSAVGSGRLTVHASPQTAEVFVIAVPTPFKDGKKPDLTYVEAAARAIAPVLKPGNLVILESTSPVGTTEAIGRWISEVRPDLVVPTQVSRTAVPVPGQILLAHCPERVLPGQILRELVDNDRIIGGIDPASTARTVQLYQRFVAGRLLTSDSRTAEMTKLTENAFRDVNIAFANELSLICDRLDLNVWELIRLANHHPRVKILQPGPGVGGHCIAVDPWFIVDAAPEQTKLIRTAREVNDFKPQVVIDKIRQYAAGKEGLVIAFFGLTFKANVGDIRESPALKIVEEIARDKRLRVMIVDPEISGLPESLLRPNILGIFTPEEGIRGCDVVVMLVNHAAFSFLKKGPPPQSVVDPIGFWNT